MSAKNKGAIRTLVDQLMAMSQASDLTLEQVADVLDGYAATMGCEDDKAPATEPHILPMAKRVQ